MRESESEYEKYLKANEAIKDILFMYRELVGYSNLFDDFGIENGKFDPSVFVSCNASEYGIEESDAKLLHEGSAIKLICMVLQAWGQGGYPVEENASVSQVKKLIEEGKLRHIPELEKVLKAAMVSDVKAWALSKEIYVKYVLSYFRKLAAEEV